MRLSDLTVQELLALANLLLKIADDDSAGDPSASGEITCEIRHVVRLIMEKIEQQGNMLPGAVLN